MFVDPADGWEDFPTATTAAGHALQELRQGQLDISRATAGGGTPAFTCEGVERSSPSAPPADGDTGNWRDDSPSSGASSPLHGSSPTAASADHSVHLGLLELERPRWLPDSGAVRCRGCHQAFRPLLCLRHHCRMCGKVFCHACCSRALLLPPKYGSREPQRTCGPCGSLLAPLQPFLAGLLSNAVQPLVHDAVDSVALRSWLNPPWSATLGQDIYKATNILRTFATLGRLHPERCLPASVLAGARALVLVSALRVGAGWSAALGTGLMVARSGSGWSAPCAVGWCSTGWGLQVGGQLVDVLLVLRDDAAVSALCSGVQVGLGGSLSAAVGPLGRCADAALTVGSDGAPSDMYSYCVSRGAYLGVGVSGTVLAVRGAVNLNFYGYPTTARELLLGGAVPPPPAAAMLYDTLDSLEAHLAPRPVLQQAGRSTAAASTTTQLEALPAAVTAPASPAPEASLAAVVPEAERTPAASLTALAQAAPAAAHPTAGAMMTVMDDAHAGDGVVSEREEEEGEEEEGEGAEWGQCAAAGRTDSGRAASSN